MYIYFIGGIHGTGKTSICQLLSEKYNIPHYSSGMLINKGKQIYKQVDKINDNQEILIKEIERLSNYHNNIILDGHYTLLDKSNNIQYIPEELFSKLNIKQMILLKCNIDIIYNRLKERDNIDYDKNILLKLQKSEENYYNNLCNKFKFQYKIYDTSTDISHLISIEL